MLYPVASIVFTASDSPSPLGDMELWPVCIVVRSYLILVVASMIASFAGRGILS